MCWYGAKASYVYREVRCKHMFISGLLLELQNLAANKCLNEFLGLYSVHCTYTYAWVYKCKQNTSIQLPTVKMVP